MAKKKKNLPVEEEVTDAIVSEAEKGFSESHTDSVSNSDSSPPTAIVSPKPNKKKKRTIETISTSTKKSKKEIQPVVESESEIQKSYFQRLWSEGDEIVILQGMIDFKSKTDKNPLEDVSNFFDSIKESITYEVKNLTQFTSKIQSLRKKFLKKKKKGAQLSFSNDYEEKFYELAQLIWGSYVEKKNEEFNEDWFEKSFLPASISQLGISEESVKRKWRMIPKPNKKKLEEKIRVLEKKELETLSCKSEILHDVISMFS